MERDETMYTPPKELTETDIGQILDFVVCLSRDMIVSGANLERRELAADKICSSYDLRDISIFLLSTHMSIAAKTQSGLYASRQITIPPAGIHLSRLKNLNRLSYRVCAKKPVPSTLQHLLEESEIVREYPDWAILLGQIVGMLCLCFLFNGSFHDAICVAVITAVIHYLMMLLSKLSINRFLCDFLYMFAATCMAIFTVYIGFADHFSSVVITITMLILPGIPLVNAVRNLICDHEINGFLQIMKVAFETLALAMGTVAALGLFGRWITW